MTEQPTQEPGPEMGLDDVPWGSRRLEARCQRRLANFVRCKLQPDEQIVAILSRSSEFPSRARGTVALVLTSHRLFELRVGAMTARPRAILATYARTDVTVEWVPDPTPSGQYTIPSGKLSVTGPFGTRNWWAQDWRQFHASAVAIALDPRLRRRLFESDDEPSRPPRNEHG
jgi:hypothetical protein